MRTSTRDRLVLPILLPLGILMALVAVLFAFSRVLLSLEAAAATITAIVVAISIVVVSGIAANRAVVRASSLAAMLGVIAGVAMLVGGIALIAVSPATTKGETGGGGAPALTVTAQGLKFDTATIDLTANTPTTIRFVNKDAGVQHNIAIYQDDTLAKVLFKGDLVTGPGSTDYAIRGLTAGTYYFHCDVHPTMNGKVVVSAGGAASAPSGGATAQPATVVAKSLSFDTDSIVLPAGTGATLTFDNQDPGTQHNIAIYPSSSDLSSPLFRGEPVTGPGKATYQIPPLDAGTYYFQCDFHPAMNGTVTVK